MNIKTIQTDKIKVFPEIKRHKGKMIIELRKKEYNNFMSKIGDLISSSMRITISNTENLRTMILSSMTISDFLNIYEYFKKEAI